MRSNKKLVDEFFIRAYNDRDYGYVLEHFSIDYVDNSPAGARGADAAVGILQLVHGIFPDIQCETLRLVEEGDTVVHHGRFSGTHKGEYCGVPASGKRIEWEAMEIFRITDSKIVESWGFWPDRQMIEQMQ